MGAVHEGGPADDPRLTTVAHVPSPARRPAARHRLARLWYTAVSDRPVRRAASAAGSVRTRLSSPSVHGRADFGGLGRRCRPAYMRRTAAALSLNTARRSCRVRPVR
jgi:hypothetical protein